MSSWQWARLEATAVAHAGFLNMDYCCCLLLLPIDFRFLSAVYESCLVCLLLLLLRMPTVVKDERSQERKSCRMERDEQNGIDKKVLNLSPSHLVCLSTGLLLVMRCHGHEHVMLVYLVPL